MGGLKTLFCDRVYLITTVNSDRINETFNLLKSHNVEFDTYVAIDYNVITKDAQWSDKDNYGYKEKDYRKSISLTYTYKSILYDALYNNYKQICIFEDDIRFVENWKEHFINFYVHVQGQDWSILNCGVHSCNNPKTTLLTPINEYVNKVEGDYYATHFNIINTKGIKQILHNIDNNTLYRPIDFYYIDVYKDRTHSCFTPIEKVAYQYDDQ